MALDALLFDLDGTLTHSDPLHYAAFKHEMAKHNFALSPEIYETRMHGRVNADIIRDLLPQLSDAEGAALSEEKETRFRKDNPKLEPVAGLHQLLNWAKERGLKMAVVTNAPKVNAAHSVAALGLATSFDAIITPEDAPPGKPDPAPYLLGLKELGVEAANALAFEDSGSGIKAAIGADLRVVGITSSETKDALQAFGATLAIPDFSDDALWDLLVDKQD